MKTMPIGKFKASCLEVLNHVARTKEKVVVTKCSRPWVKIVPHGNNDKMPVPGRLSKTLLFEKDIVSPLGPSIWSPNR